MSIAHNPFALSHKFAGKRLHLGICGSIACYKAAELLRAWLKNDLGISVVLSEGARKFVTPLLFQALGADPVYDEMFGADAPFAHLEPGACACAMLIAPASANTIAKMAQGLADDLLSAQYLAFAGPCVLAPAMNPRMWQHPATQANLELLRQRGCAIVWPDSGLMADGETGQGRLAALPEIYLWGLKALAAQDLRGIKVMVTLGPTREQWDVARFWSNPSSGRMGAALATAAWLRGASVTAICGPGLDIYLPRAVERVNVTSAGEMLAAAEACWPGMGWGIFCAAVADFRPETPPCGANCKFKKDQASAGLDLHFEANADILATLAGKKRPGQKILGFAAETTADLPSLLPLARLKLERKKADLLAANRINQDNAAFGADAMPLAVVDCQGAEQIWKPQPKADLAWELLSWLLKL